MQARSDAMRRSIWGNAVELAAFLPMPWVAIGGGVVGVLNGKGFVQGADDAVQPMLDGFSNAADHADAHKDEINALAKTVATSAASTLLAQSASAAVKKLDL
jgi:hypothetical protein